MITIKGKNFATVIKSVSFCNETPSFTKAVIEPKIKAYTPINIILTFSTPNLKIKGRIILVKNNEMHKIKPQAIIIVPIVSVEALRFKWIILKIKAIIVPIIHRMKDSIYLLNTISSLFIGRE
nr:hypothetical protein [Anaerovorax odorimutans]